MPSCPRCGSENEGGIRFCGKCGAEISDEVYPAQPQPPIVQAVNANYVIPRPAKSVGLAILLTFFFGPFGMFYSTVTGALIMLLATFGLAMITAGVSALITWPICIVWGAVAAQSFNEHR